MVDLAASCKDKLAYFRIKDLKDVLTEIGLPKQGKKQDLVDRILSILSDDQVSILWAKRSTIRKEKVAKLVDDTYRRIQGSGAADLASSSKAVQAECVNVKFKEEIEDSIPTEKIRCLCGCMLQTDSIIKCEDRSCNAWQHIACVLIPERPMESILPSPIDTFYCEICRLARADPFWVTTAHLLRPVKLNIMNVPASGSNLSQSIEKTFQLTRADRDLLTRQEYDVQAWCMLLNDKVKYRMHWPQYADLQVNGVPVRAINRPGSQLLGANGRDDGPIITQCTSEGINKIFLGGCDARIFCLGVRIVKRRTLPEVLSMIPKEDEGERFEDALSRVRICVGGGPATDNADSDSDIEVIAECIPVNLRCPMSGLRIKVAGRFKGCAHMGCFDLEVFVEMNQRSRKWQCPICLKNYCLEKIIIDPYFNRITSKMRSCAEDVSEIEVKPDGSWRAKAVNGDHKSLGELGLWHIPDGTIAADTNSQLERKPIKEEVGPDSHPVLQLDFKNHQNGIWEFNDALQGISHGEENFECNFQNIIPMSSSATVNGRECENGSVNQDSGANFDISSISGPTYESICMNIDPVAQGFSNRLTPAAGGDADIIVLSDSEEELDQLLASGDAYRNGAPDIGVPFPVTQHGVSDSYYEDPTSDRRFDLYGANDEDFGIHMWPLPGAGQGGSGLQLFGSDVDVADSLLGMQHDSPNSVPSVDAFTLAEGTAAEIPVFTHAADMDNSLVDNPLAFGNDDPSLQIFLPTRPSAALASSNPEFRNHPGVPNDIGNEDWISLRLGNGAGVAQSESTVMGMPDLAQQQQADNAPLDPIVDNGSLFVGSDGSQLGKSSRERSESPFVPRQRRSVRRRLYLSIDSDSG